MTKKWRRTGRQSGDDLSAEQQAERDERFRALVGKRLLLGFTFKDREGNVLKHAQHTGWITHASEEYIEFEDDETGQSMTIPPVLDNITPLAPGTYRLRSSGRIVVDPDLYATYDIYPVPDDCPDLPPD